MRAEHLLISLIGLFFCFIMIVLGIFLFFIAYIPQTAQTICTFFLHHHGAISYLGLGILFLGLLFLTFLLCLNRRRYFLLKMGGVSIEDHLIAHFAKETLQPLFPEQLVECNVIVKRKKKIEIIANVPFVAEEKQEYVLKEIENELSKTLRRQCQYDRDFILNICFADR